MINFLKVGRVQLKLRIWTLKDNSSTYSIAVLSITGLQGQANNSSKFALQFTSAEHQLVQP